MNAPMPPPQGYAPPPQGYVSQDESHLNLLAILHYVYAGLLIFSGFAGAIYIVIGVGVAESMPHTRGGPPPELFATIFTVVGVLIAVICWTKSAFLFWAARSMQKRQRHTLCFVMACIECIAVPMGTILGVFTIMTLNKPSVKALFAQRS
jgi:hypothetical protein